MLDRVNPVIQKSACSGGLLPSLYQAHVSKSAEPHIACAAIQPEPVYPRPSTAWADLQIETSTTRMQADLGERPNFCFGELLDEARHEKFPCGPYPRSTASIHFAQIFATMFRAIWTLWKEFLQAPSPPSLPNNAFSGQLRLC